MFLDICLDFVKASTSDITLLYFYTKCETFSFQCIVEKTWPQAKLYFIILDAKIRN